jgi:hypothetical protein
MHSSESLAPLIICEQQPEVVILKLYCAYKNWGHCGSVAEEWDMDLGLSISQSIPDPL